MSMYVSTQGGLIPSHEMQQVLDPSIFKCFRFEFSTAITDDSDFAGRVYLVPLASPPAPPHACEMKRRVLYLHTSAYVSSCFLSRHPQRRRMHVKRRALYLHTSAAAFSLVTPSASACMRNDAHSTYIRQHTSAAASSRVTPTASACM